MSEKEMSEEDKKFKAEVDRILEEEPDDKFFEVPIVLNLRLHKMRYLGYINMLKMIDKHEDNPEAAAKAKEDFKIACFCSGLDAVIGHMAHKLMGEMLKGALGQMLKKELDKEDDD